MKAKNIIPIIIALLVAVNPVLAITLRTQAADFVTQADITATVDFDGFVTTANPTVDFQNVASDAVHTITHSAPGYFSDEDELYFDPGLNTCTGQTCSFQTASFNTFCSQVNGLYNCAVSSNGITQPFIYNRASDLAFFVNFLVRDAGNPPSTPPSTPPATPSPGQAPLITATVTPQSGLSPLVVTFNNTIVDDGQVASVIWFLGNGETRQVQARDSFSYTYTGSGTYTITVRAIDNLGLQSERTFTVVVDNTQNPPVVTLPFDDSELFQVSETSVDFVTNQLINPSTIIFGGVQQTGTPWTNFLLARSNTQYLVENSAPGYMPDSDVFFFDFGLKTCTGASCDLVSRDTYGETFNTQCNWNQAEVMYDCAVTNSGITNFFIWNPQTSKIVIVNYLVSQGQGANTPPTISATATPLSGASPLNVTFNVDVVDNVQVDRTVIYFDDGRSTELTNPNSGQITHTYNGANTYTARVSSWDNAGLVSTQEIDITVSGNVNGNNLPYNNQVLFTVAIGAEDFNTGVDINPSTVTFNSITRAATPLVDFTNVNSNTVYSVLSTATGYVEDEDFIFFDFQLPQCTGASCSFESRNLFGEVFETQCDYNTVEAVYECFVANAGEENYFLYNPATNVIVYANLLVADSVIANDNPASIFVSADPTLAIAPVNVTFQNSVSDLDGVDLSIWFFGDGTSQVVNDIDQITHIYTQPGVYNAQFVTWDWNGVAYQRNITITATLLNGQLPNEDDRLHLFIRSIRLPEEVDAGETADLTIFFENDGTKKLNNAKVIATIPELGIRASAGTTQKLYKGEERKETLLLEFPEDTEPGTYTVRIQIKAGNTDRILHREIEVREEPFRSEVAVIENSNVFDSANSGIRVI